MANGPTQTVEQQLLEWLLKGTAMPAATTARWIALHSADPGDTGANELTGTGSYARAQRDSDTNNTTHTNWNALDASGVASKITNVLDITFPPATANWNTGNPIQFFSIWTASTAGTCLWSGTIAGGTGVVVLSGSTLKFVGGSPGQLQVTLD